MKPKRLIINKYFTLDVYKKMREKKFTEVSITEGGESQVKNIGYKELKDLLFQETVLFYREVLKMLILLKSTDIPYTSDKYPLLKVRIGRYKLRKIYTFSTGPSYGDYRGNEGPFVALAWARHKVREETCNVIYDDSNILQTYNKNVYYKFTELGRVILTTKPKFELPYFTKFKKIGDDI